MKFLNVLFPILVLAAIFLQGCASERLQRVSAQERNAFTCQNIHTEIRAGYAEMDDAECHTCQDMQDSAASLLFVPFTTIGRMEMFDRVDHAKARIDDLDQLKKEKGCPPETGRFIADADKK